MVFDVTMKVRFGIRKISHEGKIWHLRNRGRHSPGQWTISQAPAQNKSRSNRITILHRCHLFYQKIPKNLRCILRIYSMIFVEKVSWIHLNNENVEPNEESSWLQRIETAYNFKSDGIWVQLAGKVPAIGLKSTCLRFTQNINNHKPITVNIHLTLTCHLLRHLQLRRPLP